MTIKEQAAAMKLDSPLMAVTSAQSRNQALTNVVKQLNENQAQIFSAN